ncbi:hypothetical protein JF732_10130 [Mycobacterium intracellulare]|uniref:Uncharacterized protein n=1 Tax=Mycobacterium intracellulare TaxID=1767 RepID=A0AAE4RJI1_MYCIT|nr:hypothetical protein [Mycobacterium intracellulare]MCA2320451.1 hypothetical protein [Mycobacterium intracellulare]MCA2340901.1 hypothetical protein [Mycobacterium intracellulare]MDV6980206.1 hypothetical protein [Mycobacterium intracellulare]MDV6985827.1 hypothetical protein [Mycobacterium intracellulare]MDV7016263.1 hypothetical protein [Mycobacterium intracellulare]
MRELPLGWSVGVARSQVVVTVSPGGLDVEYVLNVEQVLGIISELRSACFVAVRNYASAVGLDAVVTVAAVRALIDDRIQGLAAMSDEERKQAWRPYERLVEPYAERAEPAVRSKSGGSKTDDAVSSEAEADSSAGEAMELEELLRELLRDRFNLTPADLIAGLRRLAVPRPWQDPAVHPPGEPQEESETTDSSRGLDFDADDGGVE